MKPSNFCIYPWSSVLQNSEAETIAQNIMLILSRTGNIWRTLSWEEYEQERLKDMGNPHAEFSSNERSYFNAVKDYCISPETAKLFSPKWKKVVDSKVDVSEEE